MELYQVQSNDCLLQVYERGKTTSEIALLFLHGGPGSGAQAIMELSAFQRLEKNYRCIYFDQRGSGKSIYNIKKGISRESIIEDVYCITQTIKAKGYDRIVLWGGSFGGCLAALCMETYPSLYEKCILSSPAITFSRKQALVFFEHMQAPYMQKLGSSLNHILQTTNAVKQEEFFANQGVKEFVFSAHNPSNSLRHICAMGSWYYTHTFDQLFKNLKVPTLLLQGKDDPICVYENIDEIVREQKNEVINYHLYEHCGHAVFEDQEEVFVKEIVNFIGGN